MCKICKNNTYERVLNLAKIFMNEFKTDVVLYELDFTGWHFAAKDFAIANNINYKHELNYIQES